jgi:hypothetical protein
MDSLLNLVKAFEINQPIYIVTFGKAFGSFQSMFSHATNKIVGHTDVKRASDTTGEYVNVEAACPHRQSLEYWVARSSRAMTVPFVAPESANTYL